jgi:hypothetical protein
MRTIYHSATEHAALDAPAIAAPTLHPTETVKTQLVGFLSGLWFSLLVTLFIIGLPISALAFIEYAANLFGPTR